MKSRLLEKAKQIAASGYQLQVEREDEHDGPPIYVAYVSEIPECVAQGDSPEQAKAELQMILVDVIAYMLESELDVPSPKTRQDSATVQAGSSEAAIVATTVEDRSLATTGSRVGEVGQPITHTSWSVSSGSGRMRA